jgi:hypothetical protein
MFLEKNLMKFYSIFKNIFITIAMLSIIFEVYIFITRNEFFSNYRGASEEELYCVTPSIRRFEHAGDGKISIWIDGAEQRVSVKPIQGTDTFSASSKGQFWIIKGKLKKGYNSLSIEIDREAFVWNAFFTPNEDFVAAGNSANGQSGVIAFYPSSLCMTERLIPLSVWKPQVKSNPLSKRSELNWRNHFVEIAGKLEHSKGIPSDTMERASISEVQHSVSSKTSELWCAQIAMYTVASFGDRLPVRLVSSRGYWDGDTSLRTGGHGFIEYISPDNDRWAVADPMNNILAITDSAGETLNALELARAMALPGDLGATSLRFDVIDTKRSIIIKRRFNELSPSLQKELMFHFRPTNIFVYEGGMSPIYSRKLFDRLEEWFFREDRFVYSPLDNASDINLIRKYYVTMLIIIIIITISSSILRYRFGPNLDKKI